MDKEKMKLHSSTKESMISLRRPGQFFDREMLRMKDHVARMESDNEEPV